MFFLHNLIVTNVRRQQLNQQQYYFPFFGVVLAFPFAVLLRVFLVPAEDFPAFPAFEPEAP